MIFYNFDDISKIYDPSSKKTVYNPAMINYYYWLACISYCDNQKIWHKNCCNNILNKWEIAFHKEYTYDKELKDLIIDSIVALADKYLNKDTLAEDLDISIDEYMPHLPNLIPESSKLGQIIQNGKNIIDANPIIVSMIGYLVYFVYKYNFVIFKNEEYKKIVVAFPGVTTYFQIIQELIHEDMVELSIKEKKNYIM